jgi:hypothetical protein
MCENCHNRTDVPQQSPLFDHLVGAREQRGGHVEAERLGGREINDEIEFGRLLNRDIAGLGAAQNLVDQFGSAMELPMDRPQLSALDRRPILTIGKA